MVPLARDDVPHAASRILHVAAVARDEVDVEMEDGLSGGAADVEELASNQVAAWRRGTTSRWPGLTGNTSQRARTRRCSKATRSAAGMQKGQEAGSASLLVRPR